MVSEYVCVCVYVCAMKLFEVEVVSSTDSKL
jgi:hypothetical protein